MEIRELKTIKIKISKSLQTKIRKGHPWVHFYQVKNISVKGRPGDYGVIYDPDNQFLALGLYDPLSDIRLRILQTGEPAELDAEFFRARLNQAAAIRQSLESQGTTGYRIVNGENDRLPGLTLDRYQNVGVLKLYTQAWFPHLDKIVPWIERDLKLDPCVLLLSRHVERTLLKNAPYRNQTVLQGPELDGPVGFLENGLRFEADVLQGQKTGFFLDQRENRQRVREMAAGKSVLNAFSYTGGFTIGAFAGGARSVLEIDSNGWALKAARENLKLNFPERLTEGNGFEQIQGDAFKALAQLEQEKTFFDIVILDPPAFAKNKKHIQNSLMAYTRLARAGAKRTRDGGILFAASCSAPVKANDFFRAVHLGITSAGKTYEVMERTGHALDHPVAFPEGAYLKGIFCKINGPG